MIPATGRVMVQWFHTAEGNTTTKIVGILDGQLITTFTASIDTQA